MMKHICKNCIYHKLESWYDEEGVEVDYCEINECKIEDSNKHCWRFTPINQKEDTPKIYIKELKPEEVEFALVEVFDDKFEFERN